MQNIGPVVRAFIPLAFAIATAFGMSISPEIEAVVKENLELFLVAFAGLSEATPSIREAFAIRKQA